MPPAKKLLEIFKPGNFVSAEGQTYSFSVADVAAIVASYDPEKHKAPLVIGHPKLDDPAYGHAIALSLSSSNVVLAEPANVHPEFADAVNSERYDSISASFWSPTNPRNPTPGNYYLRHIGFLGAVPPAVPGLKQPSFADDDADLITINFSTPQEPDMDPKKEQELKDREEKLKKEQASFADQQTQLDAREKALAEKEAKAREAEIVSFAEDLVSKGQLLPGEKAAIVGLLTALPADVSVSFADSDGKTLNQVGGDVLRGFLKNLPPRVDFSEHSAATSDDEQVGSVSFAAPQGYSVDASKLELHKKIDAYAKKHNLSFAEAAKLVG